MKKTRIYITTLLLILTIFVSPVQAATLIDDFNDGNADGWWFGPSHANPNVYGNWRVENGVLVQDVGGDGMIALLENYYISDQTTETQIKYNDPAGYGGVVK